MVHLAEHIGTSRKVLLERSTPSHPRISGYVLAVEQGLVLLHQFDDFEPDGYCVLREHDITSLRSGEHERHWDHMLESEGLLGGLSDPPRIDLSSLASAIQSIAAIERFLIIECEDDREPIEDFYLGELVEIDAESVHLRSVDALGQWELNVAMVPVAEITQVQFNTAYLRRFVKYIRP